MADPFTAIGTIGSSLLGGLFGSSGAKKQNKMQIAENQKNRDFQERMSNTAHQREIEDLKAAGLNPILSAHGGASSPGGGTPNIVNETAELSNSARDISSKLQQNPLIRAQVDNAHAENERIKEQTKQLQISNAQQSVLTPLYLEAGSGVKAGIDKVKDFLGVKDAGDVVGEVLDAGKNLPKHIANGDVSIPNSAFDVSRFVTLPDTRAREWASGRQGFLESLFGASQDAIDRRNNSSNSHSAKQLTEEAVRRAGEKRWNDMQLKKGGFTRW